VGWCAGEALLDDVEGSGVALGEELILFNISGGLDLQQVGMPELIEVGKLAPEVLLKAGLGGLTVEDFQGYGAVLEPGVCGGDHHAAGPSA
jgi:hypothetical protein